MHCFFHPRCYFFKVLYDIHGSQCEYLTPKVYFQIQVFLTSLSKRWIIPPLKPTDLTLSLSLPRGSKWIFVIAYLPYTIFGANFLYHYSFFVDAGRRRPFDDTTSLAVSRNNSSVSVVSSCFVIASVDSFHQLLASFPELNELSFHPSNLAHSTRHCIMTGFSWPGHLSPEKLLIVQTEFEHILQLDLIRPSTTKADFRQASEFRHLNTNTIPDSYPLPNKQDFSSVLHICKFFFPKTDDIPKTVVNTPFGVFEYLSS